MIIRSQWESKDFDLYHLYYHEVRPGSSSETLKSEIFDLGLHKLGLYRVSRRELFI